jgi:uncharacterized protein (DUF4415 family)
MVSRLPVINDQGEVEDLSDIDPDLFLPAQQVLPTSLQKKLGVRGPQKEPTKERITIRLSPDVLKTFRASGSGWQSRMDSALRDWLQTHSLP